jgi:Mg-chelatase subunit ChlI
MLVVTLALPAAVAAQNVDRKDVRRGNRDFKKEEFREAEIDYMKALVKDSTSVAANYNIANAYYRQGNMQEARKNLDRIKESASATASAADYFYNLGDVALATQDYQTAVTAFAQSLMIRPDDLDAKENFIYAKKMLQNQQNNQNQDQNQNNDQNQDQNQNDDQNNNQDQNQNNDQNNDQNQNKDQDRQNQQGQQPKISPQAAQQMLQAIQAKEKETQDKVNEQKAKALKSRQKEKNW